MNENLIAHWNSVVNVNDVVFHLGDMFFCGKEKAEEILGQLNGNIIFIYGNHDKVLRNQFKMYNAFDYLEIVYNSTTICMSHYPIACWNKAHYGSIMLYGHVHGGYDMHGWSLDVGWDKHFRILPLDEAVELCKNKPIETL